MIASLEIFFTLLFIGWFLVKGMHFKKKTFWKSLANVKTSRLLVDGQRRSYYSRKEIVEIYKRYKLPQKECNKFLFSKEMQSVHSTSVVSYDELKFALEELATRDTRQTGRVRRQGRKRVSKNIRLNQVSISESTFSEGFVALVQTPRCEAGKYYHKKPNGDPNYPWGVHFNK